MLTGKVFVGNYCIECIVYHSAANHSAGQSA